MEDKWIFIVNPIAGNRFAAGYADEVKKMILKFSIDADVVFTEREGHATLLADE